MDESLNKMLKEYEISLKDNLFITGSEPSYEDAQFFKLLLESHYKPQKREYPSVWSWYSLMILFEDEVIKSWKAPAKPEHKKEGKGGEKGGKKGKKDKPEEKKEEKKEEKGGDDDLDLFGDDNEEDKKVLEEMKNKKKGEKKNKKK